MKKKNNTAVYISLLSILLSNAVVVYGVVYQKWNFFMVIYSYRFAELISSVFDKIKLKTLRNRNELPPVQQEDETQGRFFFLFIYWVFIIVIVGFITAPEKTYGENIFVILFMNDFFNINLLTVFLGELILYLQNFILNRNYVPTEIADKTAALNKKTLIMHVSIIMGTFAWFAMNTDKFFFHIDAGEYGVYGFMIVFVAIRFVGDLLALKRDFFK